MSTSLPAVGQCPKCKGIFRVISRTVRDFGSPVANDVLKWKCEKCGHIKEERRHLKDGVGGEWPASMFSIE